MPDTANPAFRPETAGRVAIVVKGWPRLSETFVAQELVALEERGFKLIVHSLRRPVDGKRHAIAERLTAPVVYLPEYLWIAPLRVWRAWRALRAKPAYRATRALWLQDLRRDRTPNRVRRFGQALVLAHELAPDVAHLHAHFIHTPASVARYAARLTGRSWSASAHAKDIWTTPDWDKRDKLREAAWCVTCTRAGAEHLRALAPEPARVHLVYHGLDPARWPSMADARPARDGSVAADPVRVLSVGRAVEKKGYDVVLDALARLPAGLHWRFTHLGGGKLLRALKRQADRLGLAGRIDWRGAATQDGVLAACREADLFVLASRIEASGDRDGLPNVLMEAMSQGLPVVATTAGAIPELVEDGVSGRIVPPEDAAALAQALAAVMTDPARRAELARAGEARVRHEFPMARGIDRLALLLERSLCASDSTRR